MKNILKVNGFFYILFFISILTGQFKMYINITLITLFHELGHIFMGLIFHYKIERIVIVPFGALTVFNKRINEYFIKDLIITIAGPLNQILLIPFLDDNKLNILLLFFNLLPIIPLDGSKILNLILNLIFPYRLSYKITFYISITLILLFFKFNLTIILFIIIYIINNIKYIKNINFFFNKFLFERYLYGIKYIRARTIFGYKLKNIKRFHNNDFLIKNKIFNETEILSDLFDNKRVLW